MARLAALDPEKLSPEQKKVADEIRSGPRGGIGGPFEAWLRAPGFANHAQKLGAYCRFETSLPADIAELAILLTGKYWKAQYEFWAHARLARKAGLAEAIIEAIRTDTPPPFGREIERVVHAFVTEYLQTHRVSDGSYASALKVLGERGVVELVGIVGYYGLVSMTLNVFEVALPGGEAEPLA